MKYIKELYKNNKLDNEGDPVILEDIGWIERLVDHMKKLEWSDSIDGLPEGRTIEDENVLLLWNTGDQFLDLFMSDEDQHDMSPTSKEGRVMRSSETPSRNLEQTSYSPGA